MNSNWLPLLKILRTFIKMIRKRGIIIHRKMIDRIVIIFALCRKCTPDFIISVLLQHSAAWPSVHLHNTFMKLWLRKKTNRYEWAKITHVKKIITHIHRRHKASKWIMSLWNGDTPGSGQMPCRLTMTWDGAITDVIFAYYWLLDIYNCSCHFRRWLGWNWSLHCIESHGDWSERTKHVWEQITTYSIRNIYRRMTCCVARNRMLTIHLGAALIAYVLENCLVQLCIISGNLFSFNWKKERWMTDINSRIFEF